MSQFRRKPSPQRRRLAAALALAPFAPALRAADAPYPARPITLVVPAAPGGSPDILARLLAPALAERLGQNIVIDNRPGGAGNIANGLVARAQPDGHTLLVATDIVAINQTLFRKLPFDARSSFAPVVHAISSPQVFAVHPDVPARGVQEFLKLARAQPERFALASPAVGTTGQLGVLLLQSLADVKVKPVVYRSAQPALTDVLGRHADGVIVTIAPALPFIREGKLRALGVSTARRSPSLPEVPTFVEQGLPGFSFDSWQGIAAPAGTPRPVIERLNREFNAVLADPAIRAQLLAQAFEPVGGPPEVLARTIEQGIGGWAKVIEAHGLHLD